MLYTCIFDRVALARAVYAPTKYVLLDDPLSAVVSCKNAHRRKVVVNVSQGLAHRATLV
jgi:ABC-type nitrate/sulfonate/bicarbonate transport system ATPase subunit